MGNQPVSALTPIPDFEGYYFDANGDIFSDHRGSIRKLKPSPHGGKTNKTYYRVRVLSGMVFIHRLVAAYAYGGRIPAHLQVNHIDGNTENNRPENLEVVTHLENSQHAKLNGLYCSGEAWYKARGKTPETSRKT